jgi:hypothetical protein
MTVVCFQFVLVCDNYIIVIGSVLMLPLELFDCVQTEPDTKFKLVRMSAATRGNDHQHQMKVLGNVFTCNPCLTKFDFYLYALFCVVMQCLMVLVPGT